MFERVSVTGHRPQHLYPEQQDFAQAELARLAVKLRAGGSRVAISGMALGVDQWWAHYVLQHGYSLWAFIPFPQQPDRWHHTDQRRWRELRAQASSVWEVDDHFSVQALHARNALMLDHSDLVVAAWLPSKTDGGTASQVAAARKRGIPRIIIDLDQMKTTTEGWE
jgi:uncharacterized phage-like protein YoqJ